MLLDGSNCAPVHVLFSSEDQVCGCWKTKLCDPDGEPTVPPSGVASTTASLGKPNSRVEGVDTEVMVQEEFCLMSKFKQTGGNFSTLTKEALSSHSAGKEDLGNYFHGLIQNSQLFSAAARTRATKPFCSPVMAAAPSMQIPTCRPVKIILHKNLIQQGENCFSCRVCWQGLTEEKSIMLSRSDSSNCSEKNRVWRKRATS